MKTKFVIHNELFGDTETTQEAYDIFEKYYKEEGWVLDKGQEEAFIILDIEYSINVGDIVKFLDDRRKVVSKCYYIDEGYVEYELEIE